MNYVNFRQPHLLTATQVWTAQRQLMIFSQQEGQGVGMLCQIFSTHRRRRWAREVYSLKWRS